MATYEKEEISHISIDDEIFHIDCVEDEFDDDDIVLKSDIEQSKLYFCDKCKKIID